MKAIKLAIAVAVMIFICLLCLPETSPVRSAQQENYCFTCHTNPRKLIEITRELAQTNLDKPGASAETKGEG